MILIDVFSQESEILLIKFQIPVVFWAQRKSCDAKPGLGLRLAYQSLASRITPQGLVTIFIFFPSTLKTTREESKMSNFHTTLFQNSFVLVS